MEVLDNDAPAGNTHTAFAKNKLFADMAVQSFLVLLLLMFLITQDFDGAFITLYGCIGSYQFISALVHYAITPHNSWRKAYYPQLYIHLLVLGTGFATQNIMLLYISLFTTPLSALYYYTITLTEYGQRKK